MSSFLERIDAVDEQLLSRIWDRNTGGDSHAERPGGLQLRLLVQLHYCYRTPRSRLEIAALFVSPVPTPVLPLAYRAHSSLHERIAKIQTFQLQEPHLV